MSEQRRPDWPSPRPVRYPVDIAPAKREVNQIRTLLNQSRAGPAACPADQSSSVSRTTTSTRATRAPDGGSGRPTTVSAAPGMSRSWPEVSWKK